MRGVDCVGSLRGIYMNLLLDLKAKEVKVGQVDSSSCPFYPLALHSKSSFFDLASLQRSRCQEHKLLVEGQYKTKEFYH